MRVTDMKRLFLTTAAGVFCAGSLLAGEDLLKSGNAEDAALAKRWSGVPFARTTEGKRSGEAAFQVSGQGWLTAPDLVEVDAGKSYELKAFIKVAPGQEPAKGLLGVRFYSADKSEISPVSVCPVADTATTLAADAKAGDKTVLIAPAPWATQPNASLYGVAFNAQKDLSDLPNLDAERIVKIEKKGENYEVTLRSTLKKAYPAGTAVRQHRYVDYPSVQYEAGADWREVSLKFSGKAAPGAKPALGTFWPGAKYVRINIFCNMDRKPDKLATVLVDDISFSEVTP